LVQERCAGFGAILDEPSHRVTRVATLERADEPRKPLALGTEMPSMISAAFLLVLFTPHPLADAELERQQGIWEVAASRFDGEDADPALVRTITRTVEGARVVWKRDGKSFAATAVELRADVAPNRIDVIPEGGPERDKRRLGIYRFSGDRLTICMAGAGRERPTEFSAEKGDGRTLMEFRRIREDPSAPRSNRRERERSGRGSPIEVSGAINNPDSDSPRSLPARP
jgi:uncharacterized protein (TIGR03067 family)